MLAVKQLGIKSGQTAEAPSREEGQGRFQFKRVGGAHEKWIIMQKKWSDARKTTIVSIRTLQKGRDRVWKKPYSI